MKVERIDLFEFKATASEKRFKDIKRIADAWEISIEEAFSGIVEHGIDVLLDGLSGKET